MFSSCLLPVHLPLVGVVNINPVDTMNIVARETCNRLYLTSGETCSRGPDSPPSGRVFHVLFYGYNHFIIYVENRMSNKLIQMGILSTCLSVAFSDLEMHVVQIDPNSNTYHISYHHLYIWSYHRRDSIHLLELGIMPTPVVWEFPSW